MKQKDWSLIIIIAAISAVFALVLSNVLIGNKQNRSQKAEVVEPISSSFIFPDKQYFNDNSIDPTKLITIGNGTNDDPFKQ